MTHLHQAAERLRIYSSQPSTSPDAAWQQGDYTFGPCKVMTDIMEIAEAMLPFLDDSAITAEALEGLGFVTRDTAECSFRDYFLGDDDLIEVRVYREQDLSPDAWINHCGLRNPPTTLGALKMLLAAIAPNPKGE
jgi:hypothetical protein